MGSDGKPADAQSQKGPMIMSGQIKKYIYVGEKEVW